MNRLAGIIVAAVGLVVCVVSITKILPGLTQSGVVLILFGGLIIGLSFISKPETDDEGGMSAPSTLVNMFFSPSEVFRSLRRHPRWLLAVLIMSILSATYTNLFLYRLGPDTVANFAIDKTLEMPMLNDAARAQIEGGRANAIAENKRPVVRVAQAVTGFAGSVFGFSFLGLIYFLFVMALGGKINFWQAFTAAVYASFPVSVLRFVLNSIVLFLKEPSDIHPILGQQSLIQDNLNFLVLSSQHPVIFTLLGALSLLGFYWVWLTATGLKNAGERVTGTAAWSAALAIYGCLILLGVALAALFPSFIS